MSKYIFLGKSPNYLYLYEVQITVPVQNTYNEEQQLKEHLIIRMHANIVSANNNNNTEKSKSSF